MLARMGENMQVIAITHLPQVASKGSAHYLVYKEAGAAGVQTHIRPLEGPDRVREIARMLENMDAGTGLMHEGVFKDDPARFTRPWFAWANSIFSEFAEKAVQYLE